MKAVIIAHGYLTNYEILKNECMNSNIIICADGGAEFVYKLGIIPNYLIGDFDSIDEDILEFYKAKKIEIIKYPSEKDYTDTEICINKALELKCDEICILAGIGGRIDHTLGNLGLLHTICKNGAKGYFAADDCYIYLCKNQLNIKGNVGDVVSIIPFNGDVVGVNLQGFKYPLCDAYLEFGRPIGISNEMLNVECAIKIESGELLVIKNFNTK